MAKAKDAFRTISEVAAWLDTPTHVLRFWESKFSQIKPVKGAGGRRYYRPNDMELLGGIKKLLHEDGLTIKGTQKLLREKGVKYVAGIGQSMTDPAPEQPPTVPPPIAQITTPQRPPKPALTPLQETLQFGEPLRPAPPDFQIDLPKPPKGLPKVAPRLIGRAPQDATALQAHAAQIAPLLARLEDLSARMRG